MVNLYIVYEINLWPYNIGTDFTLGNSLFEAVKLTKNNWPPLAFLDMVLDLMQMEVFHDQMVVGLEKM